MKHKVVINNCYGGFGLSPLATAKLYQCTHPEDVRWVVIPEE